jgi:hypothetical protein
LLVTQQRQILNTFDVAAQQGIHAAGPSNLRATTKELTFAVGESSDLAASLPPSRRRNAALEAFRLHALRADTVHNAHFVQ